MRSFRLGTLAAALLLLLLPLVVSSCYITCACVSTPDPNWTPPPISDIQAGADAAKVAGVPSMTAIEVSGLNARPFYRATADNTLAFVDAEGGDVLEVIAIDRMPEAATTEPPTAAAKSAADEFMTSTGLSDDMLTESSELNTVSGVSAYDFTWTDSLGSAKFTISVNPATQAVFAYADLRMQLPLTLPILGQNRATAIAVAARNVPGDQVNSASLTVDFSTGAQVSTWDVSMGVPIVDGSQTIEQKFVVRVDALTGATTIVKS
jgi:hypothetical protein